MSYRELKKMKDELENECTYKEFLRSNRARHDDFVSPKADFSLTKVQLLLNKQKRLKKKSPEYDRIEGLIQVERAYWKRIQSSRWHEYDKLVQQSKAQCENLQRKIQHEKKKINEQKAIQKHRMNVHARDMMRRAAKKAAKDRPR